ncbi:hypothetical protein KAH55_09870, partial [bacterium]|nr:hypothetical protein [bacterium]
MGLLGIVLGISTEIGADILSEKLLDKFRQDLFQVIGGLVLDQHQKFKREFSEAAYPLKEREIRPAIKKHFAPLTADRINEPLALEKVKNMFMESFLRPEFRETNRFKDLDPKYRHTLKKLAQEFNRQFEPKFVAICERNSVATTRLVINSLAESGKKEQEILDWLKKISAGRIDLSAQLTEVVELQLVPVLRKQIELEFSRFRDWDFTVQHLRGQTSDEQAAEKEWLETVAQVLKWNEFKNIKRSKLDNIRGELFRMEEPRFRGKSNQWVCWGCYCQNAPDSIDLMAAIGHMKNFEADDYLIIVPHLFNDSQAKLLRQSKIELTTLDEFVNGLLDIENHKISIVEQYENEAICRNYIQLKCHRRETPQGATELSNFFQDWIQNKTINQLALLGDFGTGKTEFCRRIEWQFLKAYEASNPSRIPVVIKLRDHKGLKLRQMIDSVMNDMGLKKIDYQAFRTLNRLGRFVILIDGFDEMDTYASLIEMKKNFRILCELVEGESK